MTTTEPGSAWQAVAIDRKRRIDELSTKLVRAQKDLVRCIRVMEKADARFDEIHDIRQKLNAESAAKTIRIDELKANLAEAQRGLKRAGTDFDTLTADTVKLNARMADLETKLADFGVFLS